ncbi:hypothetical protein FGB62_209g013 [Gracilaria domingensis]|nr:hypothetical protein FGB62_209g013 [Gracilaria domingensis]
MGSTNSEAEVSDLMNHAMRRAQAGTKTLVLLKNMHLAGKSTMNTIQAFLLSNRGMLHYLLVMVAEPSLTSPSVTLMRIASISNFFSFEAPRNFRTGMTCAIERLSSFESDYRSRTLSSSTALDDLAAGWNLNLLVSASLDSDPAVLSFSHMLKTADYGCYIENETDQEIILDALVDDIFSKERIDSISLGSVSVVKPPREPDVIRIPIDREKRARFLLDLPLQISPEWYYMPSATTKAKRSKKGRLAVQKLVSMSRGMTQSPNDFKETTVIMQDEAQAKVDEILQRALELPDTVHADSSDFSSNTSLDRFWKTEKVVLGALITSIKSVAKNIIKPDRLTPKRMNSLSVFKQELVSIRSTASHKLPSLWKDVAKISDCVRNIPLTKEPKLFSMSHILRPNSFMTALRFEAAAERGVSPHTPIPVLSFRKQVQVGECLLSGLGLNGAIWDCKKECFVLSGSSSGNCGTVALQWRPADNFGENEHIIDAPLYGTSPQNILIATMRISMDKRHLHRLRRLCGVSCFVVEV